MRGQAGYPQLPASNLEHLTYLLFFDFGDAFGTAAAEFTQSMKSFAVLGSLNWTSPMVCVLAPDGVPLGPG